MATVRNPAGRLSPIGQALESLGQAFFSGPTPQEREQAAAARDLAASKTALNQQELAAERQKRGGRKEIARLFRNATPNLGMDQSLDPRPIMGLPDVATPVEPTALASSAAQAGLDPDNIGQLFRFFAANQRTPGGGFAFDAPALARAEIGAGGGPFGPDESFTTRDREAVARRNAANETAQALAEQRARDAGELTLRQTAPTLSEARGQAAADLRREGALSPLEDKEFIGARVPQSGENFITPDGRTGRTLDEGLTDMHTGEQLPPGTTTFRGELSASDASSLTTSTASQLEKTELALGSFEDTLGQLEQVAQDPAAFGLTGNLRRFGQGVLEQGRALAGVFGPQKEAEFQAAAGDLVAAGVDPGLFDDPDLTNLDKLATLAAYQAASALANQEGRGLSDRDFQMFRRVIGDPTALLSNRDRFQAGLDQVRQMVAQRLGRTRAARQSGLDPGQEAPQPVQPGNVTVESVQSMPLEDLRSFAMGASPDDIAALPATVRAAMISRLEGER